jgi:hypothetical protein
MKKKKPLKYRISIDTNPGGVSIWLDNRWFIDASTITTDGRFVILHDRVKRISKMGDYEEFKVVEEKNETKI